MFKKYCFIIFLFVFTWVKAQEFNCSIIVNADQISVSNNQIFKTLENSLNEFINQTQWTNIKFEESERVKSAITIIITEQTDTNSFAATIQVQASRPVFNSTYYSPILNYKDNNFNFNYTEHQPLNFNINSFDSNLISVITYYNYLILGLYMDTFSEKGGQKYLETALKIARQAQQSSATGWKDTRTDITRFTLVNSLLFGGGSDLFRKFYLKYHFDILDSYHRNQKLAAKKMALHLMYIEDIYEAEQSNNSTLFRFLMDVKADEIVNSFRRNRGVDTEDLMELLNEISSNNSKKWKQIYSN